MLTKLYKTNNIYTNICDNYTSQPPSTCWFNIYTTWSSQVNIQDFIHKPSGIFNIIFITTNEYTMKP